MKKVWVFEATGTVAAYAYLYLKGNGYEVLSVGHRKNDNGFLLHME